MVPPLSRWLFDSPSRAADRRYGPFRRFEGSITIGTDARTDCRARRLSEPGASGNPQLRSLCVVVKLSVPSSGRAGGLGDAPLDALGGAAGWKRSFKSGRYPGFTPRRFCCGACLGIWPRTTQGYGTDVRDSLQGRCVHDADWRLRGRVSVLPRRDPYEVLRVRYEYCTSRLYCTVLTCLPARETLGMKQTPD